MSLIDVLIAAYLASPALLVVAAVLYALTRTPDRLQLASLCLLACVFLYLSIAYEFITRDSSTSWQGLALGAYALLLYVAMAALAVFLKVWAWRIVVAAFGLHLIASLAMSPIAFAQGGKVASVLLASLALGAVGLWATLHRGSRDALS